MHKKMLPFFEFKEDEIDIVCYYCESLISYDESLSDAYRFGLEKVEEFLESN